VSLVGTLPARVFLYVVSHQDTSKEPHSLRAPRGCSRGCARTVTIRTGTCGPHLFTGRPLDAGRLGYVLCAHHGAKGRRAASPCPAPPCLGLFSGGTRAVHRASDDGRRRRGAARTPAPFVLYKRSPEGGACDSVKLAAIAAAGFHPPPTPNHRYHSIEREGKGDDSIRKNNIFLTFSHVASHLSVLVIPFT